MKTFRFSLILIALILITLLIALPIHAKKSQAHWASIQKAGVIRIGTAGDYPPLTAYNAKTGQFSGNSITLANKLAQSLGLKAEFVKTTWPTLSSDLNAHKFDIALGGITATPQRAHDFILSRPIGETGKVPLTRCDDSEKYTSIPKINQETVTVVENKGGTNEEFARKNLPEAKKIIVAQNHQAFEALLQKQADVMITDSVEAVYQQKIIPDLCAVNPDKPFTHDERVILIPKGSYKLQKKIDAWVRQQNFVILH